MYTIPQRETVAGLATARSIGSKIRFIRLDIAMISPLTRQSFLLSSSTVFMLSIQIASTGPSKTSQKRWPDVSCAHWRKIVAKTPSVHSWDTSSNSPYSRPSGTALGEITGWFTFETNAISSPAGGGPPSSAAFRFASSF